jgi:hypothetical protein
MHKVFKGLHSDMQRSFQECRSKQFEPTTVKTVDSWMQLPLPADMRRRLISNGPNGSDDDFFPNDIQRHILNEQSTAVMYKFNVGGRAVSLHFVVFNKRSHNLNMNEMAAKARRVCALLHLVSMHAARSTCSSTLSIFIYMTDFKKLFPDKKGEAFESEHANTGLSYHCAMNNDVVVYRKEEWFKVLIHELFHAFGLSFIESDLPDGADAAMQAMLQKMYAISHPVRIYETYCEIWARILNVVFACFTDGDSNGNGNGNGNGNKCMDSDVELAVFGECVMKELHKDAAHALHQCAKIMHHLGIPSHVLLNPTEENRAIVAEKYRENTNVFAYYVLTCALQHSHELFLEWCYKNNPTSAKKPRANVMQFRTNRSNFNSFMELLHHSKGRCPDAPPLGPTAISGSSMRMTLPVHDVV